MKNLKDILKETNKEIVYNYYLKFVSKPQEYSKITREEMYNYIIKTFKEKEDLITDLCSIEEINILKRLIDNEKVTKEEGYLDYVLLDNLKNNFLINYEDNSYYIPKDIFNLVKMALNIYNEEEYTYKDVTDSVIIGMSRIYNVLTVEEFINYLKEYNIIFEMKAFHKYINKNPRLNRVVAFKRYNHIEYVISLENKYSDYVLKLKKEDIKPARYTLEETVSIGKYSIDLFIEPIFDTLSFLESNLEPKHIKELLDILIIIIGKGIMNYSELHEFACGNEKIYYNLFMLTECLPCWLLNGNSGLHMKLKKEKEEKDKQKNTSKFKFWKKK